MAEFSEKEKQAMINELRREGWLIVSPPPKKMKNSVVKILDGQMSIYDLLEEQYVR